MTNENDDRSNKEEAPQPSENRSEEDSASSYSDSGWVAPEPKLPHAPKQMPAPKPQEQLHQDSTIQQPQGQQPQAQQPATPPEPHQQPQYQQPQYQTAHQQPYQHQGGPYVPAPRQKLSFGAGLGIGVGIGCAGQLIAFFAFIFLAALPVFLGSWWLAILIPVVAIVMMFFKRTRSFATGILIASAAAWIVFFGPCLALTSGAGVY